MFNLVDVGERAGSGILNILRVSREQGRVMPAITEQLEPERMSLSLVFKKVSDKVQAIKRVVQQFAADKGSPLSHI